VSARLIDATEAGELLGVPKSWVFAEARADRIPHLRLGRYVRFEPEELEEWWRARRRGPTVTRSRTRYDGRAPTKRPRDASTSGGMAQGDDAP